MMLLIKVSIFFGYHYYFHVLLSRTQVGVTKLDGSRPLCSLSSTTIQGVDGEPSHCSLVYI